MGREHRRLYRSTDDRVLAGVAGGLAEHLHVDVRIVRVAFAGLALMGGLGLVLYAAFWAVVPQRHGPVGPSPAHGRRRHRPDRMDLVAFSLVAVGVVLLTGQFGLFPGGAFIWPVLAAAVGVALIWRQADEAQRARWSASARGPLGAWRSQAARVAIGAALVAAGVLWLLVARDGLRAARDGLLAVLVAVAGLALITGPWWWRLATDLGDERRARVRAQERAELAAHIHDSVLQTLALIQSRAGQPREVQRLARAQERELRGWLFGRPGAGVDGERTLVAAVETAAAEVEDMHATSIDVVAVGDCSLDDRLSAIVAAAREAMVNAAKFAGVDQVQVFVEVEGTTVTLFVRDRGVGFDLDAVDDDRRGVSESIVGRMTRNGGTAAVRTSPGHGTEVELGMTRVTQ